MPSVVQYGFYNGAKARVERLGLKPLWKELIDIVEGFRLLVSERKNANGSGSVRELIDASFRKAGGWSNKAVGDVDWIKSIKHGESRSSLGVEVQVSSRCDLLIVDVVHLRDRLMDGTIDVGVIVVPGTELSGYLADRGPSFEHANEAVVRARAQDFPLIILGIQHDGSGAALPKQRTRHAKEQPLIPFSP